MLFLVFFLVFPGLSNVSAYKMLFSYYLFFIQQYVQIGLIIMYSVATSN